jgi:hypothetical protein
VEGNTGQPDSIEPSFEDGRHPVPPNWQNERFGCAQAFHISHHAGASGTYRIVYLAFRERYGLEVLCIEAEILDLMTTCCKALDDVTVYCRSEAACLLLVALMASS